MKSVRRKPARTRLRRLLLASHLGLTVGLCAITFLAAGVLLRAAIQQQAEAQVDQAAAQALRRLDDGRLELAVVARLLAERPTLQRLLQQHDLRAASRFLETYRASAGLQLIRVARQAQTLVEVGTAPPQPLQRGLQFERDSNAVWRVERHDLDAPADLQVWLVQRLSARALVGDKGEDMDVALVAVERLRDAVDPADRQAAALRHVVSTANGELVRDLPRLAAMRIDPLRTTDGAIAAVLSVGLPRALVEREAWNWILAMALGTTALAAIAALLAQRLARTIARPFAELASASNRLGLGDLETPLPNLPQPLIEADSLARNLESMRLRLWELTERERTQRRELDAVLDGVDEGIIAIDEQRRIQYANRRFVEMSGGEPIIGRFCGDVLLPHLVNGVRPCEMHCPLLRARQQGIAQATERCALGGNARNLVIRSTVTDTRQVAIVREETPPEASRAMRDAILANLSHEFQTPLAAQIAAIELLRDHVRQGEDVTARKLVDSQYRGALRLSQLVDNLLDSVRLDSGEMRLRNEVVDLVGVLDDAIDLMQPLLDQRDQHVVAELVRSDRVLHGDRQRLLQVVVNLLANANKFAPDQSRIWLELVWGGQLVSLWVEDEGPGLPAFAASADLFAPFRRAPDEEPSQRGSGLGLAIVRALVERHGGEVVIGEPRFGKGARFGIVLPVGPP